MFGVAVVNRDKQNNFVYNEREGGKGTNEINSILGYIMEAVVLPMKATKLTAYADNCGGQNKNNYVLVFLLLTAQLGWVEEVNCKFFIKRHTKKTHVTAVLVRSSSICNAKIVGL